MKGLKGKAKSLLRHTLSVAVSAALLAFVFAGADFEQLARTLRAVRPGWLLLAGALLVVADLLMALKCWVLRRSMSVRGTILSYCRMRFFSLLPGGNITGEAARLMYLRNMTDGYVATTLMIIDKQTQMIPQQTLCLPVRADTGSSSVCPVSRWAGPCWCPARCSFRPPVASRCALPHG